jgi:D-alanine-D-alanine ligase
MKLGRVAVLMGGPSAEREISLISGNAVLAALRSKNVDAHPFDPAERELWDLKREKFDRAFIALHGRFGEDGTVQGALEVLRVPVHRQRRDGLGARDGQVAHEARLGRLGHRPRRASRW